MKTKIHVEENYKAFHINGKTLRLALDSSKPIKELVHPEFYDIKLTNSCKGNCPYCYQNSIDNDHHYNNIVAKFNSYFQPLSENDRPFQIAFGGGEPTSHPDFIELMEACHDLGIIPNYTTNGMWSGETTFKQKSIIYATKKYCGGVAVSTHPHLEKYWKEAVRQYLNNDIFTNLHIIIGGKESIDQFEKIYNEYHGKVKYFVLLPLSEQGRCSKAELDWDYLVSKLPKDGKDIAFGANFYPYLTKNNIGYKMSLYEPECFSAYIDLKDNPIILYKSSFDLTPKEFK